MHTGFHYLIFLGMNYQTNQLQKSITMLRLQAVFYTSLQSQQITTRQLRSSNDNGKFHKTS